MIKLSFLETKIIKNGPVTVCIMKCVLRKPNEILGDVCPLPLTSSIIEKYNLSYDGSFQVTSKVTKVPGDQENSKIAQRLAESKTKRKAYDKAKRIMEDYTQYISDFYLSGCFECSSKLSVLLDTEDKHIEKLKNEL